MQSYRYSSLMLTSKPAPSLTLSPISAQTTMMTFRVMWIHICIRNIKMDNRNRRGVKGTFSCRLCRQRKQMCDFTDPNTECTLCVKQNQPCGPKQTPDQDKEERDKIAKEREYQKTLDQFIKIRLQRGQTWETILEIMNPDGRFAPATMQTQLLPEWFIPSAQNTSWAPNSHQPFPNETQNTYPAGPTQPYPTDHFVGSYDDSIFITQTYNTRGSAIGEQIPLPNLYSGHTQAYSNSGSMLDPSSTITDGPSETPGIDNSSFAVNYNPWTGAPFMFYDDGNQSSY